MTKKQKWLYWSEWRNAKKVIMQKMYFDPKEAEQYRHTLHVKALGFDKSSKEFSNAEFDQVLAVFRSYSRPADLNAQLRQIDQPKTRAAHALRQLVKKLDLSPGYVDGIALRICKKKVSNFEENDFPKLIAALNYHSKRKAKNASQVHISS